MPTLCSCVRSWGLAFGAQMVKLLGAECIVVGIQPDVAFSMVQLGLTLEGTTTALDLEDGLSALRERIGAEGNPL